MLGWVVRFMGVVNIGEFAGENSERGKLELRNGIRWFLKPFTILKWRDHKEIKQVSSKKVRAVLTFFHYLSMTGTYMFFIGVLWLLQMLYIVGMYRTHWWVREPVVILIALGITKLFVKVSSPYAKYIGK